jgi:hypothetical protein
MTGRKIGNSVELDNGEWASDSFLGIFFGETGEDRRLRESIMGRMDFVERYPEFKGRTQSAIDEAMNSGHYS